ncbi:MAG: helix-turn-helix transcriptional regulator [Bacillaceae bacterium]|nr:helix-turn-helix transcriptional regulator [Bacillaceae bacterium]
MFFVTKSLTHEKIAFVKEIAEMLQTLVLKIIRTNQGNSEELPTIGIDSYSNETRTFDYEIPVNIGNNELRAIKQNIEKLSLTNREKEVLFLVIKGLSNQDIGDTLFISPHTVKNHITNIYKKLDVADRSQAFALIYQIN